MPGSAGMHYSAHLPHLPVCAKSDTRLPSAIKLFAIELFCFRWDSPVIKAYSPSTFEKTNPSLPSLFYRYLLRNPNFFSGQVSLSFQRQYGCHAVTRPALFQAVCLWSLGLQIRRSRQVLVLKSYVGNPLFKIPFLRHM